MYCYGRTVMHALALSSRLTADPDPDGTSTAVPADPGHAELPCGHQKLPAQNMCAIVCERCNETTRCGTMRGSCDTYESIF